MARIGVVDLGTNTVRLLVAEVVNTGFLELYSGQIITRLGESLSKTGKLTDRAIKDTSDAVRKMQIEADHFNPFTLHVFGTSAVRDASNTSELASAIKEKTGADLVVIAWEEEARLSLLGAGLVMGNVKSRYILFDIGGGSTEFILSEGNLAESQSTDLGVVRLTEKYISKHPADNDEIESLTGEIEKTVKAALTKINAVKGDELVGTAGTVTSLAAIALNLSEYDAQRINNYLLTSDKIIDLRNKIFAMTIEERSKIPALSKGREDLIVPGIIIIESAMKLLNAEYIRVSDYGLREGLLMKLIDEK